MTLEVAPGAVGGELRRWAFHPLPTRPMVDVDLDAEGLGRRGLAARLRQLLGSLDPDAVVRLRFRGEPRPEARELVRAAAVRSLAPETMTVTIRRPPRAKDDCPGPLNGAGSSLQSGSKGGEPASPVSTICGSR